MTNPEGPSELVAHLGQGCCGARALTGDGAGADERRPYPDDPGREAEHELEALPQKEREREHRHGPEEGADTGGNVILCSSFSKTLCPGYRIGWIIGGRWQERVEHIKMTLGVATSAPAQMAVGAYLATGAYVRYIRKVRQPYASNLRAAAEALGAAFPAGTRVTRPTGGMVLWVEVPPPFDSVELFEEARAASASRRDRSSL